jgi:trehalose 6-phosphate synthase
MPNFGRLVVVSNRVPTMAFPQTEEERRAQPVGGLVSALRSALEEHSGLWFGWSGTATERRPGDAPQVSATDPVQIATLDLSADEVNLFYSVFANRTLWPLLHSFLSFVQVRHDAYRAYRRVNRRFAESLSSFLREDDVVWVHDYHLISLGAELRSVGWRGKIGFFLHTPFPSADVFAVLPWSKTLMEEMLTYDLVGFHTRRYAYNMLDALVTELGGTVSGNRFTLEGQSVQVGVYPIGTDPDSFEQWAREATQERADRFLQRLVFRRDSSARLRIILGVDRLDYTKGIPQRLLTFEQLLESYPALRGKVSMVQISAPSRSRVPEYVREREWVDQLVGRINGRFSEADWVPVQYLYRSYSQQELAGFYREADVCLVTPLRDGMNLVAKEFVASQGTDPGVLVLSKFCGAAETMQEALIVNPYDLEGTADALHTALLMPLRERRRRHDALLQEVRTHTAQDWGRSFLDDLLAPDPRGGMLEPTFLSNVSGSR